VAESRPGLDGRSYSRPGSVVLPAMSSSGGHMRKVFGAIAVAVVVLGLGVRFAREYVSSTLHHVVDLSLPTVVSQHTWWASGLGHARGAVRVRFDGGHISTVRCHSSVGDYTLDVTHEFAFTSASQPVSAHCPGVGLRHAFARASRVDLDTHGRDQQLTFRNASGTTVLVLQGRSP
jgi:hypothetical protein